MNKSLATQAATKENRPADRAAKAAEGRNALDALTKLDGRKLSDSASGRRSEVLGRREGRPTVRAAESNCGESNNGRTPAAAQHSPFQRPDR